MTSSSREKLPTTACSVALACLSFGLSTAAPVAAQESPFADSYTIDVSAALRRGTARTLSELLISQVPGLLVIPGSGLNGTGSSIRLAGTRSLMADLPPLILLDGTRIDAREDDSQLLAGVPGPSRLDDIPIDDIESIEVLRSPASAAIYGPGAGAGVILISTKRGGSGPVRVEGFAQGAMRVVPSRWPANWGGVDADNPNVSFQQGLCTLSAQAQGGCVQDYVQTFNPLVERSPFASTPQRQIGLSAAGGPSWGAFRVSGAIEGAAAAFSVPAVTWDDDYQHWNIRASGSAQPAKNIDLVGSVARVSSKLRLPMYQPIRSALLGPSDSTGFSWESLFQSAGTQELDRTLLGFDGYARPRSWLTLHAAFGRDEVEHHEGNIVPGQYRTWGHRAAANQRIALQATASDVAWRSLQFTTTLGFERLTNEDDARLELIRPDTVASCGSGTSPCSYAMRRIDGRWNSSGFFAVERVAIRKRVFVTGTLRHDWFGAQRSGSETHPSLAVDWLARPEQAGTLGRLAFRAVYGTVGHPIPALFEVFFVGSPSAPSGRPEPERTREFALSAEASGLGRRWHAQASLYDLRSSVLDFSWVAGPSGLIPVYVNGAVMSNRGVTASLWANVIDRPVLGWDVRLSIWGNRNRLVKRVLPPVLYGDPATFSHGEFEGYPANGYFGQPITFADANGDGIITGAEVLGPRSFIWAGTPYPTQGAALTSSWRIARHWWVSTTLDYRAGQTLFNRTENIRCSVARCREQYDPATPLADQASAVAANVLPLEYFEKADYLKLREIALTFDVPERAAAAFGARGATVMVGGRDLATWSKYSGPDPEAGSYGHRSGGTPTVVSDFGTVPLPRSWMLRVRVSY